MEKLFYSIGEVDAILDEPVSLVRFWSNSFPELVKPERNAKLNRRYTAADIETLKQIHFLVKEKGMTLDGASRQLRADRKPVDSKVKALEVLREIRKSLEAVKNSL